ncbi:response regulator [Amaricoccus sp. W119]|uniref:response regulator n=1 Tax=Amaricoccus sp. W119 TaxID=3391833 RepID=UPI0039A69CAF
MAEFPGRPWRLLVIDDDDDFAESLAKLLSLEGHETRVAQDAASARAVLADWAADVALVDVRLGRDDGVALVGDIRRAAPRAVVVMMTAYASLETAIGALKAGAYDFLMKPFFFYDLDRTLGRCFERLRLLDERDAAEEKLRRAQRLDALGQLSAGVAHEFNNTLAVILGNLQLLGERLEGEAGLREMVEDALGAVRGGMELTSRLLSHARGAPLHAEVTDLAATLPATLRLLDRALGDDIAIVLDVPEHTPPVLVDRGQLEASLINLAINARDAMTEGGTLIVAARAGEGFVDLSLTDTGPGLPDDVIGQAAEPFVTTKPAGRGLGLGLAMVAAFAERSGGALRLDSRKGEGLTATIRLPVGSGVGSGMGMEAAAPGRDPIPTGRSERLLVVEDDADLLRTLGRQMEHLGYRVTLAAGAEEASALLGGGQGFDLLVTDIGLGGGRDGMDLAREAAGRHPGLALLLLTADPARRPRGPVPGAGFLVKPVDLGTLARAVRAALQARGAASGAKT